MDAADRLLSEDHRVFRDTCRKFAEREISPFAFDWEEGESFPRELYGKAAAAGLLSPGFPEHLGGSGGDVVHQVMAIEGLLRGGSTGVVAGLGSLGIALPPLLNLGNAEQIERFARPVLRGEAVAALAVTEPGAGSDVAGLALRAEQRGGPGGDWVLSGAKTFITSGARADLWITLARTGTDPHGGLTFFAVARDQPEGPLPKGMTISRPLRKTGWRASDTAEIFYDEVVVPDNCRLGKVGSGFMAVMQNFAGERLGLAAYAHASAHLALEYARNWAGDRRAFGRSLSGFQVTRHKLATMATEVLAARVLTYTLALQAAGGARLVAEVAMAKNFNTGVAERVCYEAVQLHGGMGYMRETAVERLSRDVRLLAIGGGTREIMNEIISKFST